MNKSIAIIIQARINSKRCKNKMLRRFVSSSLFEIQVKKLNYLAKNYNQNVFCAIGELPLKKILKKYKFINLIERNETSISSDAIEDVFNYLKDVKEEYICFVNACAPLLKLSTLKKAITLFTKSKIRSLTSVVEKKTWYFDHKGKPINDNSSGNTKDLSSIFECTHNFHIFNKRFFLKNKKYWSNKKNDPYLYQVNFIESLDIDTEEEFNAVQKIYKSLETSNLSKI